MRRKNRQFKITVDVPEQFKTDEEFAQALLETMYSNNWVITVVNEDDEKVGCDVSKIQYAGFELDQEEEE